MQSQRVLLPGAIALLAASPSLAFTPFSQVRQDHPVVQNMLLAMPNSGIDGTLNRISALFSRAPVRGLPTGAGADELLPENLERLLLNALLSLRLDLKDGVGSLTLEEKYILLQVLDVVLAGRLVDLYSGYDFPPCIPTPEHPCPDLRPVPIIAFDQVAGGLRSVVIELLADYNASNDPDISIPAVLSHRNFTGVIDQVRDSWGYVRGVESIDD